MRNIHEEIRFINTASYILDLFFLTKFMIHLKLFRIFINNVITFKYNAIKQKRHLKCIMKNFL